MEEVRSDMLVGCVQGPETHSFPAGSCKPLGQASVCLLLGPQNVCPHTVRWVRGGVPWGEGDRPPQPCLSISISSDVVLRVSQSCHP